MLHHQLACCQLFNYWFTEGLLSSWQQAPVAGNLHAYRLEASYYGLQLTRVKLVRQLNSQKQVAQSCGLTYGLCTCYLSLHDINNTDTSVVFAPGHTAGTAPDFQE